MQDNQDLKGTLRPPTPSELQSVNLTLRGCKAVVATHFTFLVHELSYREVYAFLDPVLVEYAKRISAKRNVYFAGIYAGSFRGERFRLSLDFAERLYRLGCLSNTVVVDQKQEQRFLYGRDLEGITPPLGMMAADFVVVVNKAGDVLGLGRYEESSKRLVNLVDKGWYLRRGH
ncbi:MAG: hypothetical protein QW514_00715 [Thermoprotei archaeon]